MESQSSAICRTPGMDIYVRELTLEEERFIEETNSLQDERRGQRQAAMEAILASPECMKLVITPFEIPKTNLSIEEAVKADKKWREERESIPRVARNSLYSEAFWCLRQKHHEATCGECSDEYLCPLAESNIVPFRSF